MRWFALWRERIRALVFGAQQDAEDDDVGSLRDGRLCEGIFVLDLNGRHEQWNDHGASLGQESFELSFDAIGDD